MNQQVVDYLQTNKEEYSKKSLVEQLRNAGHNEIDITEAINSVYGDTEVVVPLPQDVIMRDGVKYAGFWIRFVAAFIDGFVLTIPILIISFLSYFLLDESIFVSLLIQVIVFALFLAYFVLMTNKYQATVGKMAVGIIVCDINTLGKAKSNNIFKREIINRLTATILPILFVVVAFTDKKQGLHDIAADTVVIYKNK